jgi:hypothetical protein
MQALSEKLTKLEEVVAEQGRSAEVFKERMGERLDTIESGCLALIGTLA